MKGFAKKGALWQNTFLLFSFSFLNKKNQDCQTVRGQKTTHVFPDTWQNPQKMCFHCLNPHTSKIIDMPDLILTKNMNPHAQQILDNSGLLIPKRWYEGFVWLDYWHCYKMSSRKQRCFAGLGVWTCVHGLLMTPIGVHTKVIGKNDILDRLNLAKWYHSNFGKLYIQSEVTTWIWVVGWKIIFIFSSDNKCWTVTENQAVLMGQICHSKCDLYFTVTDSNGNLRFNSHYYEWIL